METPARPKETKKSKNYVIPYLPVTRRVGLSIAASSLILAISSLTCIVIWKFVSLPSDFLPWCFALSALSFGAIFAFLFVEKKLAKECAIRIEENGIVFPFMFGPDLLFRPTREWNDIAHVLIGSLSGRVPGAYEFELEKERDTRHKIFIYFKSGGHAYIDLRRMSKKGYELLFVALEPYCIDFHRSPQLRQDGDEKRSADDRKQISQDKPKSFTELWEEEMHDHFSATNFVPLRKGKLLRGGRFRVLMQIAAGGLSAIYLAETPEKELRVIKEASLPPTLEDSLRAKAKELFTREATILQRLSHPKIAKVLDYFVEDGRDYLVLEFVPGHTLRQLVRQNGAMKEEEVLKHARQVAEILEYLHAQTPPVIHRDITPDNLVLREDGAIVIIDFGAANQVLGSATGTLIGKQAYISPEQFRGRSEAQSDIYALGGSMHFMLTGQDPEALSASHPRSINSSISPGVDALVAVSTAEDLSERISSASALFDEITKVLNEGGGVAITTGGGSEQN
jgi:tRNA A-37 threonylcarbamoyl transferase component Bud32